MGFTAAVLFARWNGSITILQALGVALLALSLTAIVIVLVRWEGLICVAMAVPIVLVAGAIGGALGVTLSRRGAKTRPPGPTLLLPLFLLVCWGEAHLDLAAPRSVVTAASSCKPHGPRSATPPPEFHDRAEPEFIGFRVGIAPIRWPRAP